MGGYSFFANNQLLTIFSAPNYMGTHMNDAAFLEINRDLVLRIRIIRPTAEAKENQVTPLREKTLKVCEE